MEVSFSTENAPFFTFLFFFLLLYIFSYYSVFRNWGPKHRSEASSCLISLAHGTPVVLMAIHGILTHPKPRRFASPNTRTQNTVLEYSMAYFFIDFLHYALFHPSDVVFIGHHLATLYVLTTCRFLVCHGGLEILAVVVLAEMTSACQNIWSLAGLRKDDLEAAKVVFDWVSPYFFAFYSVVRGILGPVFVLRMWGFYRSGAGDREIPRWARVSWITVIVLAIISSILWVANHWKHLYAKSSFKKRKEVVNQ